MLKATASSMVGRNLGSVKQLTFVKGTKMFDPQATKFPRARLMMFDKI